MIQALSEINSIIWDIIGICFGFPLAVTCVIGAIFTLGSIIGCILYSIYKLFRN